MKVFARKGSRERDHSGPCSVIFGSLEKYCDRSSDGGGGEIRAAQNADVLCRSVALLVEAMAGRGAYSMAGPWAGVLVKVCVCLGKVQCARLPVVAL